MRETGGRGRRFVATMFAIPGVFAGLWTLLGAPSAATIFSGVAGAISGSAAARTLVPRKDLGLTAGSLLTGLVIGGLMVSGPRYLSVFDLHGAGGSFALGLYFGFWAVALPMLTEPTIPGPSTGGRP